MNRLKVRGLQLKSIKIRKQKSKSTLRQLPDTMFQLCQAKRRQMYLKNQRRRLHMD